MFFIYFIIVTGIEIWIGALSFLFAPIPYVIYVIPVCNVIAIIYFYSEARKYKKTPARGIACPNCGNQEGNTSQIVSAGAIATQISSNLYGSSNINVKYLTCSKCFTSWTIANRQDLDKKKNRSYLWVLIFFVYILIWLCLKIKYDAAFPSVS